MQSCYRLSHIYNNRTNQKIQDKLGRIILVGAIINDTVFIINNCNANTELEQLETPSVSILDKVKDIRRKSMFEQQNNKLLAKLIQFK